MKCFECGENCITEYMEKDDKIYAVRKICLACNWKSYPTKIPNPIR